MNLIIVQIIIETYYYLPLWRGEREREREREREKEREREREFIDRYMFHFSKFANHNCGN